VTLRVVQTVSPEVAAERMFSGVGGAAAAVRQKLGTWISKEQKEDLEELRKLLEAGKLTPVVDRTFPLSEVPEAIRYLRDGRARGKVVITV
jgi:NADPH:quinone reductase-like Zn-dependent oxidoreductase